MKSIVSQGKNVQKAIENGLSELGVTQDEVSIKIIDEGGLFRKAKVELTLDKEVEEKLEEKTNLTKTEEKKEIKEEKQENIINNNLNEEVKV